MTLIKKDIWEELERRKATAINKAVAAREDILSDKYEWELGVEVYKILTEDIPMYIDSICTMKLLGYPVRINYEDIEIIKLWKEVE